MALTGYAIGGIVMIVIGIILLIAGIVLLAIDQSNQTVTEWWVWALIVVGVIALLVGIALFFIPEPKAKTEKKMTKVDPCNPCPQPCPPPPCAMDLEPACPQACPQACPPTPCAMDLEPACPQACPPNPCNPCCSMDMVHRDPCKQAAAHAAEGLPPPARAGGPEAIIMPPPPEPPFIPRPTVESVQRLERPRPLDTRRPYQTTNPKQNQSVTTLASRPARRASRRIVRAPRRRQVRFDTKA